jgi:hypothetical protein
MTRYRIRQLRAVLYAQAQSPYFPALHEGDDGAPEVIDRGDFHSSRTLPRRRGRPTKDESEPWVDLKLVPEGKPAKKLIRQLGLRVGVQRLYSAEWNRVRKELVEAGIRVIPILLTNEENAQRIEAEKLKGLVDANLARRMAGWEAEDRKTRRSQQKSRASAILAMHQTHTTPEQDRDHIERTVARAIGKPFTLPDPEPEPESPLLSLVAEQAISTA